MESGQQCSQPQHVLTSFYNSRRGHDTSCVGFLSQPTFHHRAGSQLHAPPPETNNRRTAIGLHYACTAGPVLPAPTSSFFLAAYSFHQLRIGTEQGMMLVGCCSAAVCFPDMALQHASPPNWSLILTDRCMRVQLTSPLICPFHSFTVLAFVANGRAFALFVPRALHHG